MVPEPPGSHMSGSASLERILRARSVIPPPNAIGTAPGRAARNAERVGFGQSCRTKFCATRSGCISSARVINHFLGTLEGVTDLNQHFGCRMPLAARMT